MLTCRENSIRFVHKQDPHAKVKLAEVERASPIIMIIMLLAETVYIGGCAVSGCYDM